MHDKTPPGHGPKQQPTDSGPDDSGPDPRPDEGDGTAGQGSAAPDGYWLHDDYGPRTYRHPAGDAKMPTKSMPEKSKAQQTAAGAALAAKRGEQPKGSLTGDRKPRQKPRQKP